MGERVKSIYEQRQFFHRLPFPYMFSEGSHLLNHNVATKEKQVELSLSNKQECDNQEDTFGP